MGRGGCGLINEAPSWLGTGGDSGFDDSSSMNLYKPLTIFKRAALISVQTKEIGNVLAGSC